MKIKLVQNNTTILHIVECLTDCAQQFAPAFEQIMPVMLREIRPDPASDDNTQNTQAQDMLGELSDKLDRVGFLTMSASYACPNLHPAASSMGVVTVLDLLRYGHRQLIEAKLIDESGAFAVVDELQARNLPLVWWLHAQ